MGIFENTKSYFHMDISRKESLYKESDILKILMNYKDKIKELETENTKLQSEYSKAVCDYETMGMKVGRLEDKIKGLEAKKKELAEIFDAEEFLNTKDIYHHPRIADRNGKETYEVAELMAEFANKYYEKEKYKVQ